jgi:ABC-2 type transport system ATP-binding protein
MPLDLEPIEPGSSPEPALPRLAVVGLTLRYGDRQVLNGLSLEIGRGEVFGLLGPNGAGKTSAFQVLAGLVAADGGELLLDGQPVPLGSRAFRERLGVVFQQPSLDTRLSARQNLALGAALHRVPRQVARERAEDLLRFAELSDRGHEPVARFSGGLRRRLEICRALMSRPQILLLDEPTSGLDEAAFQRTWRELLALREREGLTILVTTHRSEEGERCDRVAILDGGRIIACDRPATLRGQVSGDVISIEAESPAEVAREVETRLGLEARVVDGHVILERHRGHELIPRIVELFPAGRLRSVAMHRPSLSDVFLHLTGRILDDSPGEAA